MITIVVSLTLLGPPQDVDPTECMTTMAVQHSVPELWTLRGLLPLRF